ncbi:hypothetical protein ANN_06806 [Periplaneta americana]|uniref:Uncharacterized protein n=1 Tax=Periplaneta americana TaxID=6978 RepID=A0ABQ8TGY5_PERAM|nr:hypothetical protein ANN_06806 [Periplaneta americana]
METECLKIKNRRSDTCSWKRNILKKVKVKGTEDVTYSGKLVAERRTGQDCRPQKDSCCTCGSLMVKIRSPSLNDAAKKVAAAEMVVHKRRASKYLAALTAIGSFDKIVHRFPVRGHSYLPCDRDSGVIKRATAKRDRIYTPIEYVELIVNCTQQGKFVVHMVDTKEVLDFNNWWPIF